MPLIKRNAKCERVVDEMVLLKAYSNAYKENRFYKAGMEGYLGALDKLNLSPDDIDAWVRVLSLTTGEMVAKAKNEEFKAILNKIKDEQDPRYIKWVIENYIHLIL